MQQCFSVLSKKGIPHSKSLSRTAVFESKLHTAWNSAAKKKFNVSPTKNENLSMVGGCGLDSSGSGYELLPGFCEHSNKPSSSIKGMEFLD
jgi:hypothetical protein